MLTLFVNRHLRIRYMLFKSIINLRSITNNLLNYFRYFFSHYFFLIPNLLNLYQSLSCTKYSAILEMISIPPIANPASQEPVISPEIIIVSNVPTISPCNRFCYVSFIIYHLFAFVLLFL